MNPESETPLGYARRSHRLAQEVKTGLRGPAPWKAFAALDMLDRFRNRHGVSSFGEFLDAEQPSLMDEFGDEGYEIRRMARFWHELSLGLADAGGDESERVKRHDPRTTYHTLATWAQVGALVQHNETLGAAHMLADTIGVRDPEVVRRIITSMQIRYTAGELVARPATAFALSAPFLHVIPDVMKSDAGYAALAAVTLLLGYVKSMQDVNSHRLRAEFLTYEMQVANAFLGWKPYPASFAIHAAWLLPYLGGAIYKHMYGDVNTVGILYGLILTYIGDIGIDAVLARRAIRRNARKDE